MADAMSVRGDALNATVTTIALLPCGLVNGLFVQADGTRLVSTNNAGEQ